MKALLWAGVAATSLAVAAVTATKYPQAKITFKVIDEERRPVEKAEVAIGFEVMSAKYFGNEIIPVSGQTTDSGEFTGSAQADLSLGFTVKKPGYYSSSGTYDFKEAVADKWQPWNPTVEVVLKKVGTPIAMYAKKVDLAMPAFDVAIGFDLMIGDWVSPRGKGKTPDLVFTAHLQQRNKRDYDYELVVTFSNPADGLQPFDAPQFYGSKMKSPRFAPQNGYLSEWKQLRKRAPGTAEVSNVSQSRNYLFRVRTVVDNNGSVVSALYGKIYGDFLRFTYYLNPTPNDRGLEFDAQGNLFANLSDLEKPTAP
jgi:hypothetical protein